MKTNLTIKAFLPVAVSCLTLWLALPSHANGGTLKEIELTDGSVIQAEVLSLSNGVYRLKSDTLGTFSLAEKKIRSMRFKNRGTAKNARQGTRSRKGLDGFSGVNGQQVQQQAQEMTNRLMRDPGAMELLQSLRNDPSVTGILKDPELMRAINQQDIGRLSADPKVQSMMKNRTLGKLLGKSR